jgi:hypothetical protein
LTSPLHYPPGPSATPIDPASNFDPLHFLGGGEHSQHASRGAGPLPSGPFTRVQLWDSMAALYDLVFGIRQGVEDLNYRLQETGATVDLFLRTLTTLQNSLVSNLAEDAPMKEPDPATDEATGTTMGAAPGAAAGATAMGATADVKGKDKVEATMSDERIWADQPTYVEEEPWPGDLQDKWPDFSPGV